MTRNTFGAGSGHMRSRVLMGLVIGLALAIGLAWPNQALAQGMAVHDSANLTQNAQTAANVIKQLKELKSILDQATKLYGAVGQASSSVNVPVPNWNTGVTSTVTSVKPDFASWQLPKDVSAVITSPTKAQEFLTKIMDFPATKPGKEPTPREAGEFKKIQDQRFKVQREVAFRAMGAAENAINSAPDASQTANGILTASNNDLREQTAQLIQATVGVHQELIQMRVLMAQMLELQAANTIKGLPTTTFEGGADAANSKGAGGEDPFATAN